MAELKKTLGFGTLLLLAVNAIIGTGIFFVPGIAAEIAGPASLISWIGVSIIAMFIAMCFAELVSMYPNCGGVYEYTKNAFGEFVGFTVGWTAWIVANITVAMLVIGSFSYLGTLVPLTSIQILFFSIIFVISMNMVSIRGIDVSVKVLLVFAVVTICSLWIIISWGVYYIDINNLKAMNIFPTVPIFIAMLFILETFFGWETVAYLAEETKDARKQIPRVMIWGTVAVIVLAMGVVTVALGVVPAEELAASDSPLVNTAEQILWDGGGKFIAILVFLNIIGGAAAWIVTSPRLVFALSRDKILPAAFSKIHPKYGTPENAIVLQTFLTTFILLTGGYLILLKILLPLAIYMYGMVLLSVSMLRYTKPNEKRGFHVPFGKKLPPIVVGFLVVLAASIEIDIIILGVFFILVGIPLYLFMGIEHSPKLFKKITNLTAHLTNLTYEFWAPKKMRDKMVKHMGPMENKHILDFGCSVGKLTIELAKEVKPNGKIHATEVSDKSIEFAQKLAKKEGVHKHILFVLEDAEARHKFHHKIKDIDGVVSIGTLGYLSDPDKVLKELHGRMKHGSKIYFVDYDHIFRFIPTRAWLEDDTKIKEKFNKAGFSVKVEHEKTTFWEIIHIFGHKPHPKKIKKKK